MGDSSASPAGRDLPVPFAAFALVWAVELVLARVTSQPQAWGDMVLSGLGLVVVPSLAWSVVPAGLAKRLVASVPLALVAGGIVLPVALAFAGTVVATILASLLVVFVGAQAWSADEGDLGPSAGTVLGGLVAASATAWVLLPSGFPPFQIHLPFLLVAVLLARLAVRSYGLPLVVLGGVALASWPPILPPFPWSAEGNTAGRPDILVVSVDTGGELAGHLENLEAFERLGREGERFRMRAPEGGGVAGLRTLLLDVEPTDATERALAQELASAGYDTAAVIAGEPELDVGYGLHRGFAVFHHFIERNRYALPRAWANLGSEGLRVADFAARPLIADVAIGMGLKQAPRFAPAGEVFGVAAKVMAERRSRPVFLWVHFRDDASAVAIQLDRMIEVLHGASGGDYLLAIVGVGAEPDMPVALGGTAVSRVSVGERAEPVAIGDLAAELRRAATP